MRSLVVIGATLVVLGALAPACASFSDATDAPSSPPSEAGVIDGSPTDGTSAPPTDAASDDPSSQASDASDAASDASGSLATCAAATATNVIVFEGDAGDYIHPGSDTILLGSWSANVLPNGSSTPTQITIHVTPTSASQGLWWDLVFSSTQLSAPLTTKSYSGALRASSATPGSPGLDISGDGRGCNTLNGAFTISKLQVAAGGVVTSFTASFEQHCEGSSKALRGCVHYQQ